MPSNADITDSEGQLLPFAGLCGGLLDINL